jgi:archaemetzincin
LVWVLTAALAAAGGLASSKAEPGIQEKFPAGAMERMSQEDAQRAKELVKQIDKLRPLHQKLGKPQSGDWRAGPGKDEREQTFAQYLGCNPVRPVGARNVLYVQPLGEFTKTQRRIVDLSAEFMGRYFGLPVKVEKDLPLSVIPASARRVHPDWGMKQVLTTYVLEKVLAPRLPKDAAAYIAFTASDLWPGEGWNFLFGQASLRNRVGVWSIYRNGDPDAGEAEFHLCLRRTLQIATHETGHMFAMEHCVSYECNMCGCNSLEEADGQPLTLCPECVAKLCWSTRTDLADRYRKLLDFARRNGLKDEEGMYLRSLKALGATVEAPATRPQ